MLAKPNGLDVSQSASPRILIVEDDPTQGKFVFTVLGQSGYECELVSTMAEAHERFEPGKYACVLIDLGLPDGDGTELIRELGAQDTCLVQIVLTGDSAPETIISTMRVGAFDYLTKPVNMTTLKAAISRAVAHHSVVLERAELFRLLYEEREQLRERVDAATADIRQYAAACESSNSRLRGLLHLTQLSGRYYSEGTLLKRVYEEVSQYVPLHCVVLCDPVNRNLVGVCERSHVDETLLDEPLARATEEDEGAPYFFGGTSLFDPVDYDPLLAEADPEQMLRGYVYRRVGLSTETLRAMIYPQALWNRPGCTIGFFLEQDYQPDSADPEFLDMCAYLLAFEWERSKLLFHVAHQASLGNIAVELVRNFIQPLTAIRTASDFLTEAVQVPDAFEGVRLIQENVDRLRYQTQEFRKLSTLRENSVETVHLEEYVNHALDMLQVAIQNRNVNVHRNIKEDCECLLLNGTAMARTFLDLILGALRAVDVGGQIWVTLRDADDDHVAFELAHDGSAADRFVPPSDSMLASTAVSDQHQLGMQLAKRTVHGCGGTLSSDTNEAGQAVVRIILPRNATAPRKPLKSTSGTAGSGVLPVE